MAVTPESMTEQNKDDLYETAAWTVPEYSTDRKHLIQFIKIVQEILKYKSEQVESLMNELDEIAARQGEEEARDRQDLLDEIDKLKEQLEYQKRLGHGGGGGQLGHGSGEELRSDVVRLEIQNEELVMELQEREKDLMKEKIEAENLASQVAALEREKQELQRELRALQEDAQERISGRSIHDSPEFGPEKQEELTEIVRQKNKHITQLLYDLELLEKDNLTLKNKLSNVCDELSDATSHINEMTMRITQMKHVNDELETKISEYEDRNKGLMSQIEELVEEKAKHDSHMDQFSKTLNAKVQEWKEIIEAKDLEISKAEEEIRKLLSVSSKFSCSRSTDFDVNKKVEEQEEQIIHLKNELVRATLEINSCTEMIENFKEKQAQMKFTDSDELQAQVVIYEEKIKHLEEKLKYAEEDACAKAEEISEIVIQLREYEMGEFGLSEAMSQVKQLEKGIEKRDLQIEKLVDNCNSMEIEFENLKEQNLVLRDKLGMSAVEELDTTDVKVRFRKDKEIIDTLQLQLDRKEEDLIRAKLKCRKLMKFIKLKPKTSDQSIALLDSSLEARRKQSEDVNQYTEERSILENKLLSIIKENDALRKGMHEILESIHNQDGEGVVEIQSNCLERLLEALDSRHVSGWYHPAMRLQAQLNNAEGKNEELRNQIRSFREEEKSKNCELQDAYVKIRDLESQLFILQTPREDAGSKSKTPESELEEVEMVSYGKRSLMNLEQEQRIVELEMEVEELKVSLSKLKVEHERLGHAAAVEREELSMKIVGLESLISSRTDVSEEQGDSRQLQSEKSVLARQVDFLKQLQVSERVENERMHKEKLCEEERLLREILRLQNNKVGVLAKIEELEKELRQSVPKSTVNEVTKELMEMTMKYEEAVTAIMMKYEDNTVEMLEEELKLLQREKNEILDELRIAKEKLLKNGQATGGDELLTAAEKLAASEVRELNERQKATHLEHMNLMLKSEIQELESRNKETAESVAEMKTKLQLMEREILSGLNLKEDEPQALREKVTNLKRRLKIAEHDRDNFRELFEISQGQFRSLDLQREKDKVRITSLNEEVLLLQSSGDDKAVVGRLSHELMNCRIASSELTKTKAELQDKVNKLVAKNLMLESQVDDSRAEIADLRRRHLTEIDTLHRVIHDLRKLYGTFTAFPNIEAIHKMKKRLKKRLDDARDQVKVSKAEALECRTRKEELAVRVEALEALQSAYKGDAKPLMTFYQKGSSLRLQEVRCRRQNQFLSGEVSQLEEYVQKIDEDMIAIEESRLEREREWERRQVVWENSQLEMLDLLRERGIERKPVAAVRSEETQTDDATDEEAAVGMQKVVEGQAETIRMYEWEMKRSEAEIKQLKLDLMEKDAKSEKQAPIIPLSCEVVVPKDEPERAALKVTVQSLESIIRQKEETIQKYQGLLKEGRDEHSKSSGKFQEELRKLHEALAKQSKAYNKLKSSLESGQQLRDGLPKVFEKYLARIHDLEDELAECQMTVTSLNGQLSAVQQDRDRLRRLAEERLTASEETRQSLEMAHRSELERCKAEIENCHTEIERLKHNSETMPSTNRLDGCGDHRCAEDVAQARELLNDGTDLLKSVADEMAPDKPRKDVKVLERHLKSAREESARLREQLRLLQIQKATRRPKTASSTATSRSGSDSLKEESLQSKVKTLEELLRISKEREQDLLEVNQRKIKSAEEVARWGERKKSEQTIRSLSDRLKEKEAEVEVLKNKNDSFRNMIHKCERDKVALELQLKSARGGPNSVVGRFDELMEEKSKLEKEVEKLREQLEMQQRHEAGGGIGASILYDKLESQERKLAVLELASKGRSSVLEEMEKFQIAHSRLEKTNLKLESENLTLRLQLEKERSAMKRLTEKNGELEKILLVAEEVSQLRQGESDRTISALSEKISETKKMRSTPSSRVSSTCSDRLRRELDKLREDHKALRAKYLAVVDENRCLESEVKKCRYQIRLLEEKDLADSITKTNNIQLASQLSQELIQVKSQLTHKTQLLNKVKVLLTKAAVKEKALNDKVTALQNIIKAPSAVGESWK